MLTRVGGDVLQRVMTGKAAWAAFVISVVVFVAAAWPGWLSVDSIGMWGRATEDAIYDWHSPILIWFWQHLGAASFGPLIPFLVQAAIFWTGLLLIAGRLQRLGWRLSWLIFPAAFLFDITWTVGWIWKDSLATGLLVLIVGLAASADIVTRRRWLWLLVAVAATGVVITRWYLAPLVLIALAAVLCMAYPVSRRAVLSTIGVFVALVAVAYAFEKVVIRPIPTYSSGTLMMLDIARVECNTGTPQARASGTSLFPPELIRTVPGEDLCSRFSTYVHDPLFGWRDQAVTRTDYVLPESEAQMQTLSDAWITAIRERPLLLVEARAKQLLAFLNSETGLWWSPSKQLVTNTPIYMNGAMGDGETIGFPSAGGAPLIVAATVSAVGSFALLGFGNAEFGMFALLLVPLAAALTGWRRGRLWRVRYLPALAFPMVFAAGMAVVAPAADVRYVVPACAWALVVVPLALADKREDVARA